MFSTRFRRSFVLFIIYKLLSPSINYIPKNIFPVTSCYMVKLQFLNSRIIFEPLVHINIKGLDLYWVCEPYSKIHVTCEFTDENKMKTRYLIVLPERERVQKWYRGIHATPARGERSVAEIAKGEGRYSAKQIISSYWESQTQQRNAGGGFRLRIHISRSHARRSN